MENKIKSQEKISITIFITIGLIYIIYNVFNSQVINKADFTKIQNLSTIFISIVLEAIPFILLGSVISALIQVFISEELIGKIMPRNKFIGIIAASLVGMVFPVCECAIIPIAKRLIKKGMPLGMGVTFMLAVPIVNPIVMMSTFYAFYDKPVMVIMRVGFGILSAIAIGLIITIVENKNLSQVKISKYDTDLGCYCGCDSNNELHKYKSKLSVILEHTTREFMSISKYLIFGAFLSSIFQTVVSRRVIESIGSNPMISIVAMMFLAFTLSICSEADAFIARTFLPQFTTGSVLAFLILGPMLDIKNTFMLFGNFKNKLVIKLIVYIILITFIIAAYTNIMVLFGVIK